MKTKSEWTKLGVKIPSGRQIKMAKVRGAKYIKAAIKKAKG